MEANDKSKFPKIIVAGGGFGGLQVAKKLKDQPVDVLMIDKHNYHTFQPLLYQVATGSLEPDSIAFSLRKNFAGQVVMISSDKVKPIDKSAADMMKFVISGGVSGI